MAARRGTCTVSGCVKPHSARGWCRAHYSRWQRGNDPTLPLPATVAGAQCKEDDCDRLVTPKSAKGLCPKHYQRTLPPAVRRRRRVQARTPATRFFEKVELRGDCWAWTASRDGSGYGIFSAKRARSGGHIVRAHIWSYEYFISEVPEGLQLDHICHDTTCTLGDECPHRSCVNPWHVEPVPPLVNSQRGCGQRREACPVGHRYDIGNTYINPKGAQVCRTCTATYRARYDAKKRAA